MNLLRSLWRDESGVQALETGLIAALIAIVIVGTLRNIQLANHIDAQYHFDRDVTRRTP